MPMSAKTVLLVCLVPAIWCGTPALAEDGKAFQAGAAQVDITPLKLPVIVSGYFLERTSSTVRDRLYARAFVFDDGTSRVAICIVDILFMPRDLLDEAKRLASKMTGIRAENMLISATHTHTAPSVAGALGTGVDRAYREFLPPKIADVIQRANDGLEPARIGWTVIDAPDHTHCRRWILRPDRVQEDVFGQPTVRANMHPGHQNPDFVGPAGPADTKLSLLSVQSHEGRPLAVLANYSMHYFGSSDVSADYFGCFSERFTQLIGATDVKPEFVSAVSQGTSGDLHWMDYAEPKKSITIDAYSKELARIAAKAYKGIRYQDSCSLGMLERKLTLKRRVPDKARLSWAQNLVEEMQGQKPKSRPEVYALEQIYLHEDRARELKLQVLRIGELGIAAIPCEVYGITGLKIKGQSPLQHTFNIELANGSEGYIPPPEQHVFGGYTTWPARSAALEVGAEPQIVETLLSMLEEISGKKRRPLMPVLSSYDELVLKSKPLAYWCLNEIQGSCAVDATGNGRYGAYEDGVAFYLPGPAGAGMSTVGQPSRGAHFAGGRMKAELQSLGTQYSVEMWFWNGLPTDARQFTGFLFSRGPGAESKGSSDRLGIGGTFDDSDTKGKLIFCEASGQGSILVGKSDVRPRTWHHVVFARDGKRVAIYLNGDGEPQIRAEVARTLKAQAAKVFIGGSSDRSFNFEGKIAKVAIFDRVLTRSEIESHYAAARSR
jgi:hypothetical protein